MTRRSFKKALVLGGMRSGKSRFAVELASRIGGPVLFVATATADDAEMRRRIEMHRSTRPREWVTLESRRDIGQSIRKALGGVQVVIVDCITMLVSNVLGSTTPEHGRTRLEAAEAAIRQEIRELAECMDGAPAHFVMVSNEVGAGIVPANRLARVYSEMLGWANQRLAMAADEVYLMVAGIPVQVKGAGRERDTEQRELS